VNNSLINGTRPSCTRSSKNRSDENGFCAEVGGVLARGLVGTAAGSFLQTPGGPGANGDCDTTYFVVPLAPGVGVGVILTEMWKSGAVRAL
jgi:hypothetical protein